MTGAQDDSLFMVSVMYVCLGFVCVFFNMFLLLLHETTHTQGFVCVMSQMLKDA